MTEKRGACKSLNNETYQKDLIKSMLELFPAKVGYIRINDGYSFTIWRNNMPILFLSLNKMILIITQKLNPYEINYLNILKNTYPSLKITDKETFIKLANAKQKTKLN